jgi:hypothetical protein
MMNDVTQCYFCNGSIYEFETRVTNFSGQHIYLIPRYKESHLGCYQEECLKTITEGNSSYAQCVKCDKYILKLGSRRYNEGYYHSGCYANIQLNEYLKDPKSKVPKKIDDL